jgi:hypothetical protein
MKSVAFRPVCCIALLLSVLAAQVVLLNAQGFGTLRKRKITLEVRRPAAVRLANTSVAVKGEVTSNQYAPPLRPLVAMFETELVSNERTLVKKPEPQAEWVIGLQITGYSLPAPVRRVQKNNKTSTTYVKWSGSLKVAYQVIDKSGRVHDADNVSTSYEKEFEQAPAATNASTTSAIAGLLGGASKPNDATPKNAEDVQQILIKDIVRQIEQNVGNTTQTIEPQVAGGDDNLNRAADYMDKRLWARAIEQLEKTPAYPKPDQESYRQYDLGLAYEAMSYDSKTYSEQKANLFKAQEYYDKALELNERERYFLDTVARTKETIARYRTLDLQQREDASKQAQQVAGNTPAPTPAPKPARATTVSDVIEMFTAGVPHESIIEIIRSSPVEFDPINKETVLAIAKAKLPIEIQNEMRKKVGAAPLGQAAQPQR